MIFFSHSSPLAHKNALWWILLLPSVNTVLFQLAKGSLAACRGQCYSGGINVMAMWNSPAALPSDCRASLPSADELKDVFLP